MYKKIKGLGLTSTMDRFDLEGAGAREVPRVRGPHMARRQDEPLPLWHAPKMRRSANAAKLMRATVDEAIPASPVATHPVRGDPSLACAVAKATPTEWRCDRGAR